jgi:hypothetical protein
MGSAKEQNEKKKKSRFTAHQPILQNGAGLGPMAA